MKNVILCEDESHRRFVERLLKALGVATSNDHSEPSPPSKGSAEQFVREQFPKWQTTCHSYGWRLIVVTDADTGTTAERRSTLGTVDASTLVLIPKRAIETWFARLRGDAGLNETDSFESKFSKVPSKEVFHPLVTTFIAHMRTPAFSDAVVPSLEQGVREARKLG
jgi:hypothetical protein